MIKLSCPGCGHGLQATESQAGKQGRCPRCRQSILVPQNAAPPGPLKAPDDGVGELFEGEWRLKERPPDGPRPEAKLPAWAASSPPAPTPEMPKGLRRYPWPVDVPLYPTSVSGLLNLAVFGGLLLLDIVLARVRNLYGGILRLILAVSITGYLTYYLTECVRDSADGGTRAPDNLSSTPDFRDAVLQIQDLLLAGLAFGLPAGVYALARWRIDPVFWGLVGCAAFFFPMGVLSVILFDSMSGLNPRYWLLSVVRVFVPYGALVMALAAIVGLMVWVARIMEWSIAGFLLSALVILYTAMIAAHILGRFYFRYSSQIGWGI